jgi:FkbM family methyltransferase
MSIDNTSERVADIATPNDSCKRTARLAALSVILVDLLFIAVQTFPVRDVVGSLTKSNIADSSSDMQVAPRHSVFTTEFSACMIDVGMNLPIDSAGRLRVHHWDAMTGKWNEYIRFLPFPRALSSNLIIVDVGGNTKAADSVKFLQIFPDAKLHIYEPVPAFYSELERNWAGSSVTLHNVGLGSSTRDAFIDNNDLQGESTFVMSAPQSGDTGSLRIRIVDGAVELAAFISMGAPQIDILHLNCEGCEWDLLKRLSSASFLQYIGVIQISFHNFGGLGIGHLLLDYCAIREALLETHTPSVAVPFAWERWIRHDLNS